MVMMDHSGRLGPLSRETVLELVKIGHSQLGTCTIEEIILHKARILSQNKRFPEIKSLDDIGPAVYGSDPVKMTISDFYPTIFETAERIEIPHIFQRLQASFREKIQSGMSLTDVPKLIREMVDVCPANEKANGTIWHMLDKMSKNESLGVIDALAFLWVYVGVLEKRRIAIGEIRRAKRKVDALAGRLFQAAVQKEVKINLKYQC